MAQLPGECDGQQDAEGEEDVAADRAARLLDWLNLRQGLLLQVGCPSISQRRGLGILRINCAGGRAVEAAKECIDVSSR